uniref:NADH dehydrogenase subunit 5 n=1 Tax=Saldoida armata TaxID=2715442 RepID=UPI002E7627EF|nr:NADH dehydrogenase subunit 5 [Saldoida armata]WQB61744.1 NADH dehydrogenase subunit 5 [Saldoida armata]
MKNLFLYKLVSFLFLLFGLFLFMASLFFMDTNYCLFFDWEILTINSCGVVFTILFDWMSLMFMGCVFLISSMVILYSFSYMSFDLGAIRFLFLVFLFVCSMALMILSPNLLSILLGWDGLGLVSYCLVIYFQNWNSYKAGMLTILTNRIGDFAILMSIFWMLNCGCWSFMFYVYYLDTYTFYVFLLVVLASFTSSAQIPFSSWLPAAMAAPTPVSALVHSSTLVTAGVYLLIRFFNLFVFFDCSLFVFVGLMTMFMSGVGALFECDLKKIIALSTLSQLGLMVSVLFMGYSMLSFFHLLTHAFFKALLFLCSGLIIHVMGDSQDIRYMGGAVVSLPITCTCFCISSLSLCGFPFLSGFYSKDLILEVLVINSYNMFMYFIFLVSVGLTASYSFRLIYYCVSSNINLCSYQSYGEDFYISFSMIFLSFISVFSGTLFFWLMGFNSVFVIMPFYLKVAPILFFSMGVLLGYEISVLGFYDVMFSMKCYFLSYFLGSMWFIPIFSTRYVYSIGFYLMDNYYLNLDSGWGEYLISNKFINMFVYLSKINFYIQFNNYKFYLFIFLLLLIILI